MLKDFKAFILRGNVIDLAVAVVIGAAFSVVVTTFVSGVITPIIAIPGDAPNLAGNIIEIEGSKILYGAVLDAIINFLIIAAVLYFAVVRPINRFQASRKADPPAGPTTRDCPHCLSSIPMAATRCAFCTQAVTATA